MTDITVVEVEVPGEQGATGPAGITPYASWSAGTYAADSVVSHANSLWLALRSNAVEPSSAVPLDWALWIAGSEPAVTTVAGTTYTTSATDHGKLLRFTSSSAIAVTLHASAPAGFNVAWVQRGTGKVTFAPGSGATLGNLNNEYSSASQKALGWLIVDANSDNVSAAWLLSGETGA